MRSKFFPIVAFFMSFSGWAQTDSILVPAGSFMMGSAKGPKDEQPVMEVTVQAFKLDKSPVSVEKFGRWIETTGYQTEADRFGNSTVFDMRSGGWSLVEKANWQKPFGQAGPKAPGNHPVTQVSWHDALSYCKAQNGRLPTEAEYEYAAKGAGQYGDPIYSFGDKIARDGDFLVNVYTGEFPFRNTGEDGYLYTAPVGETGITPLGFTDMAGNVWEWTSDWFHPTWRQRAGDKNPTGPREGTEKVIKGGSFLCHDSYCNRYRPGARTRNTPDSSTSHTGFRLAYSED